MLIPIQRKKILGVFFKNPFKELTGIYSTGRTRQDKSQSVGNPAYCIDYHPGQRPSGAISQRHHIT